MDLNFDVDSIRLTEFGVGRDLQDDDHGFYGVSSNGDVQDELIDMVRTTIGSLSRLETESGDPKQYSPSEKHGGTEYLILPIDNDLAQIFSDLHDTDNLPLDPQTLNYTGNIFCYFARFTDATSRRLIALRRASQFKSIRTRKVMRYFGNELDLVDDPLFALNNDFDLLVDSEDIHILHPSGFEFAGKLRQAILNAVPTNVAAIQIEIPYVAFQEIQEYAESRPRAARYLASILSQNLTGIDANALTELCDRTNVEVNEVDGQIAIEDGHIMGFLEVLDRRRYENELIPGAPERFRASSRERLSS